MEKKKTTALPQCCRFYKVALESNVRIKLYLLTYYTGDIIRCFINTYDATYGCILTNLCSTLFLKSICNTLIYIINAISIEICLTSGATVLYSKVVDGRYQVQSPVAVVNLAVRSFPWLSPKLA